MVGTLGTHHFFFFASSASNLRMVRLAQSLPSFPPQAKKAWYALEVLSLLFCRSLSLASWRANQATIVTSSFLDMGLPLIRARAVDTPLDGFPSSPTIAFLDGTDLERISKPLWALRFTITGGVLDMAIFTILLIKSMIY